MLMLMKMTTTTATMMNLCLYSAISFLINKSLLNSFNTIIQYNRSVFITKSDAVPSHYYEALAWQTGLLAIFYDTFEPYQKVLTMHARCSQCWENYTLLNTLEIIQYHSIQHFYSYLLCIYVGLL